MANKKMLVIVLVLAMSVVACGQNNALNGTWVYAEQGIEFSYKFTNGNFELSVNNDLLVKGNYSTDSGKITMNEIYVFGDFLNIRTVLKFESKFYSKEEFISTAKPQLLERGVSEKDINEIDDFWEELLGGFPVAIIPSAYSIDRNNLTLIISGNPMKLLKIQ